MSREFAILTEAC